MVYDREALIKRNIEQMQQEERDAEQARIAAEKAERERIEAEKRAAYEAQFSDPDSIVQWYTSSGYEYADKEYPEGTKDYNKDRTFVEGKSYQEFENLATQPG